MASTVRRVALEEIASSSLAENAGYILRITHRCFARALQRQIEARGVSIGMWYFLRVLWEEDGLTQRQLSQRVQMMEPTTATALRSMEQRQLITRVRNSQDKRKVNIFLTEEGRKLREVLMPHAREVNGLALTGLDTAEIETFRHVLHVMRTNLAAAIPVDDGATDED